MKQIEFDVVVGEEGRQAASMMVPERTPVRGSPHALDLVTWSTIQELLVPSM